MLAGYKNLLKELKKDNKSVNPKKLFICLCNLGKKTLKNFSNWKDITNSILFPDLVTASKNCIKNNYEYKFPITKEILLEYFFDLSFKCPDEIENCEEMRKKFLEKAEKMINDKNCPICNLIFYKSYFAMNFLKFKDKEI
jgi:hypothetical protein